MALSTALGSGLGTGSWKSHGTLRASPPFPHPRPPYLQALEPAAPAAGLVAPLPKLCQGEPGARAGGQASGLQAWARAPAAAWAWWWLWAQPGSAVQLASQTGRSYSRSRGVARGWQTKGRLVSNRCPDSPRRQRWHGRRQTAPIPGRPPSPSHGPARLPARQQPVDQPTEWFAVTPWPLLIIAGLLEPSETLLIGPQTFQGCRLTNNSNAQAGMVSSRLISSFSSQPLAQGGWGLEP